MVDTVQEEFLRFADRTSLIVQNALQSLAFLPDGRELVKVQARGTGVEVQFPDLSAEGWPGFILNLPGISVFSHAMTGVLTRAGFWKIKKTPAEVTAYLSEYNPHLPGFQEGPEGRWQAVLPDGVRVRLRANEKNATLLSVLQERRPAAVCETLEARISALNEKLSDLQDW